MQKNIILLGDFKGDPKDLQRLKDYIRDIYEELDDLYLTSDPNGVVSARRGRGAILFTGGLYYYCKNVDGGTTWKKVQIT